MKQSKIFALQELTSDLLSLLLDGERKKIALNRERSIGKRTITRHFHSLFSFCQKNRPWGKDKHQFCLLNKTNSTFGN